MIVFDFGDYGFLRVLGGDIGNSDALATTTATTTTTL